MTSRSIPNWQNKINETELGIAAAQGVLRWLDQPGHEDFRSAFTENFSWQVWQQDIGGMLFDAMDAQAYLQRDAITPDGIELIWGEVIYQVCTVLCKKE